MSLDLDIGQHRERGPRPVNEDWCAWRDDRRAGESRGLVAALADGVSGGREAAQATVRAVVEDHGAAPDTWDTTCVLDRLIGAQNAWFADHDRRRQGIRRDGAPAVGLCTLATRVLRGHAYTVAHVGDSRAWLVRGAARSGTPAAPHCLKLTQDHAFDHPDQRSRLSRAIGLDDRVHVDCVQGELRQGDCFFRTRDGVHAALTRAAMAGVRAASQGQGARALSAALVRAALAAGSRDNATALVVVVRGLATARLEDGLLQGRQLPVPPRLQVGDVLDGHTVTAIVANNGVHRLYPARTAAGRLVAIKSLREARASDREERAMLAHEVWLASRVVPHAGTARGVGAEAGLVRVHGSNDATACYAVCDWHPGRTLAQWLADGCRFSVAEVVAGGLAVARTLGRLHRLGVIHRDIQPGNRHLGDDGQWRVLDLGAAVSGIEPRGLRTRHAGTPSCMNPERWSRFRRDPPLPSRLRPDVPVWRAPHPTPPVARDPSAWWKIGLGVSLLFKLLLVYWWLFLPR